MKKKTLKTLFQEKKNTTVKKAQKTLLFFKNTLYENCKGSNIIVWKPRQTHTQRHV